MEIWEEKKKEYDKIEVPKIGPSKPKSDPTGIDVSERQERGESIELQTLANISSHVER